MSDEHKAALARGRAEARAIKAYLEALAARRPGRPVNQETLTRKLDRVKQKLKAAENPLEVVDLIQSRLEIERAIEEVGDAADISLLEAGFVLHAASYSERRGVSYTAWREFGVPAPVLRAAGIKQTRRRR
jgi:hypothetical protein